MTRSDPPVKAVTIDGKTVNMNPGTVWRGLGTVTGNNSSRLLMDYKVKNPTAYWEIMNLLFKPDCGAGLTHVKLEFGADINSSSGTEPSVMRTPDEPADVTRGAGFMFAADALSINPNITVDMLRWGEPGWVAAAFKRSREEGFAARYKWYRSAIDAAYDTYKIKFTHVSPDANETCKIDADWLIYFSQRLKSEADCRYDYGKIKIVASDEVCGWQIADEMMKNPSLRDAVDILGEHYNTRAGENALTLNRDFHKEIWYTEGIAPTNIARLAVNSDGVGITGKNGALDVCNRIINAYCNGKMTMYEYQPAAAAYYSGVSYFPKGLLTANTPWSGFYDLDSGIWLSAHFTRFTKNGWRLVDSACFGDGEENHFIRGTTHNYMTALDPETGDYTIIICNDSPDTRRYAFTLENMARSEGVLHLWESRHPDKNQPWYTNLLKNIREVQIINQKFNIDVKPFSLVTLTTLQKPPLDIPLCKFKDVPLDIRYTDNFDYGDGFARGGAPLYTTDYGGAFEIEAVNGEKLLVQKITAANKPLDWYKETPSPITTLGDDRWCNYSAEIGFKLDAPAADNYVFIGVRYLTSDLDVKTAENGCALKVFADGSWVLNKNGVPAVGGHSDSFDPTAWHSLKITAAGRKITAHLDGSLAAEFFDNAACAHSGRVSLGSGLYRNAFRSLKISPVSGFKPYVTRLDDHDAAITYTGGWDRKIAQSCIHFNRTLSAAAADGSEKCFSFGFTGNHFAVIGETEEAQLEVYCDGSLLEKVRTPKAEARQCSYSADVSEGTHTVKIKIVGGTYTVDAVEIN